MLTMRLEDVEADVDGAIAKAQLDPVFVQSEGTNVAIIMFPGLYEALIQEPPPNVNPLVAALLKRSLVEHSQVYRALAHYEATHQEDDKKE